MRISIKTERLVLLTLDEEYTETVQAYLIRNEHHFRPYMPLWPDTYLSIENIEKTLKEQVLQMYKKQFLRFFIFHKDDRKLNYILGDVNYSNFVYGAFLNCFLAYKTDKSALGKGIASEAVRAANTYIFNNLNLHRIEANIMPSNAASIRVIEKLGFKKEGISEKLFHINGKWEDHCRFALINEHV